MPSCNGGVGLPSDIGVPVLPNTVYLKSSGSARYVTPSFSDGLGDNGPYPPELPSAWKRSPVWAIVPRAIKPDKATPIPAPALAVRNSRLDIPRRAARSLFKFILPIEAF